MVLFALQVGEIPHLFVYDVHTHGSCWIISAATCSFGAVGGGEGAPVSVRGFLPGTSYGSLCV